MPTISAPTGIKLQNILFATDFSAPAQAILCYAVDLARRYHAALYTVNVLPHMPFVDIEQPDPEQIRSDCKQKLATLVSSESFEGVQHKELIAEGEVPDVISKLVPKYGIDLIMLGTGGRKGLGKLLLGSVAEDIFRRAECPVLTVGPHATGWEIDGKLRHIMFATDFGPESVHGLPYAISLAEENHARLTLLHVARQPGLSIPDAAPGTMPVFDPAEEAAFTENELRNLIPAGTELWHEPVYMVQFGLAAEMILRIAAQSVDMIVLGVKRPALLTKHLTGGVAYKVVSEAPCPVLTVGARCHV